MFLMLVCHYRLQTISIPDPEKNARKINVLKLSLYVFTSLRQKWNEIFQRQVVFRYLVAIRQVSWAAREHMLINMKYKLSFVILRNSWLEN